MSPQSTRRPPVVRRPDVAYTLEVVVADRYRAAVATQIAAAAPGPVVVTIRRMFLVQR